MYFIIGFITGLFTAIALFHVLHNYLSEFKYKAKEASTQRIQNTDKEQASLRERAQAGQLL